MYDILSQLFVLSFAAFYLVFFAVFVFWIVKSWLVPALKRHIVPIPRHVAERARVLRRETVTSARMQPRDTEPASNTQRLSSSERRLLLYALTWPPASPWLARLPGRETQKRKLKEKTREFSTLGSGTDDNH